MNILLPTVAKAASHAKFSFAIILLRAHRTAALEELEEDSMKCTSFGNERQPAANDETESGGRQTQLVLNGCPHSPGDRCFLLLGFV